MTQDEGPVSQFVERRSRTEDAILLHIQELKAGQIDLNKKMTYHHEIFRKEVETAVERVFDRSFPDGDPEGHRKIHESWIAEAASRASFWEEMRLAGAKWLGLGALGFLASAIWIAFKTEMHK